MGDHYLLNLYGCSFNSLNNEEYLKDLIETAALCSGATILQIIGKSFQPQGVTILGLLAESHISIHTCLRKVRLRWIFLLVGIVCQRLVAILLLNKFNVIDIPFNLLKDEKQIP